MKITNQQAKDFCLFKLHKLCLPQPKVSKPWSISFESKSNEMFGKQIMFDCPFCEVHTRQTKFFIFTTRRLVPDCTKCFLYKAYNNKRCVDEGHLYYRITTAKTSKTLHDLYDEGIMLFTTYFNKAGAPNARFKG